MARAAPMAPADRRALLVLAARRVFARRGYHAAGVADIIREAGVARGTFYNYFDSKRAVFQAVLEEVTTEVERAVEPIDVRRPVAPQVRANLERVLRTVMAPDVRRLLLAEAVGIDAEGDAAMRAFHEAAAVRIERALRTGQAIGIVREGDMRVVARLLLGMVKEPVFEAALGAELPEPDLLVEEALRLLREGLLRLDG